MLKEFGKSEEFQKILESTHRIFLENKRKEHLLTLESLMSKEGCERTPASIQRFLFRIRGNLHHYFSKNQQLSVCVCDRAKGRRLYNRLELFSDGAAAALVPSPSA